MKMIRVEVEMTPDPVTAPQSREGLLRRSIIRKNFRDFIANVN
jgi:hypothetical protein